LRSRRHFVQDHGDRGLAAAIRGDKLRHRTEQQRSAEADFKAAGATGPDGPRMAPRLLHAFKDSLRMLKEGLSRCCELDAPAGPHQQTGAELAFQIPDLLA
jgi:hypothetical protein